MGVIDGIWDSVESVSADIIEGAGEVVTGLTDAAASLFDGAAPLIGVATAGAAIFVVGPGAAIPAFVAGAATGSALISHRRLNLTEQNFVIDVFGHTLQSFDDIILTNLTGLKGAAFVCPNGRGQILVNIGCVNSEELSAYEHPLAYWDSKYPSPGKLLIHELVHAWQIKHADFVPGLVCEGIANQLAGRPYEPGVAGRPWNDYNLEQQATIVDEWFEPSTRGEGYEHFAPRHRLHPFFRYVCQDIRDQPLLPSGAMASSCAAVARDHDRLDVFWIGSNRQLASNWWNETARPSWGDHAWFSATPPHTVGANQNVAVVAREPDHLDVFFTQADGALGSQWWDAAAGLAWSDHGPFSITAPASVRTGSPIAAVARADNHLDVFWIRPDGAIGSAWWDSAAGQGWGDHPDFAITPSGTAGAGSGLAAVARRHDHLDVFYVRDDGSIGSQWWDAASGMSWGDHAPFTIAPPGAARPRSAVAAVARTADDLDIFWIRPGGGIGSASWSSGTDWRVHDLAPPSGTVSPSGDGGKWDGIKIEKIVVPEFAPGLLETVTPTNAVGEGSGLAAVSRLPEHIDVFYAQTDGALGLQRWDASTGTSWTDGLTTSVTSAGTVRAGSPLAAVARTSSHLDVFWTRPDGAIGSTFDSDPTTPGCDGHEFTITPPGAAPDHGFRAVAEGTIVQDRPHHFDPGLFDRLQS